MMGRPIAKCRAVLTVGPPAFFWGVEGLYDDVTAQSPLATPGANVVQTSVFTLPFNIPITALSVEVSTLKAGAHVSIGLYDANKNKVLDSGPIPVAATGCIAATGLSVYVPAGTYYLAWSCDDASNVAQCSAFNNNGTLQNRNMVRWGVAANPTVGGVMPVTLGSITTGSQGLPPAVFFEA